LGANDYAHADFPPACHLIVQPGPPPTPLHFNDSDMSWTVAATPGMADVESVALHELGHVLGLAHSSQPDAVMFPVLHFGKTRRDLSADDREGLSVLYPTLRAERR